MSADVRYHILNISVRRTENNHQDTNADKFLPWMNWFLTTSTLLLWMNKRIFFFFPMRLYFWNRKFLNSISHKQYSVLKVAKNNGICVLKTDSLKSEEFLKKLRTLSLDIILSVASSRMFGSSILSIPKLGRLNVHAGILPRYRGINPSFWSLLNQEKQSAVTVHYINEEIDEERLSNKTFLVYTGSTVFTEYI